MQKERNWLIEQLQRYARETHTRVSFLSGDVHCAAVGVLKTLVKGKNAAEVPPPADHRYMLNVVTSESRPSVSLLRWERACSGADMADRRARACVLLAGAIVNTP